MHAAAAGSWRMTVSDSPLLDHALLVRSTAGVLVTADDVPPGGGQRIDLAGDWLAWWRRLIDFELRPPAADPDVRTRMRRRVAEHQRIYDPPGFTSLAEWPELQVAAAATVDNVGMRASDRGSNSRFDWTSTRDAVDEVLAERHARPDEIDAKILFVKRPDRWWALVRPGAAICSAGVVDDPITARRLQKAVVSSSLDR
jgi:hypothetical protein